MQTTQALAPSMSEVAGRIHYEWRATRDPAATPFTSTAATSCATPNSARGGVGGDRADVVQHRGILGELHLAGFSGAHVVPATAEMSWLREKRLLLVRVQGAERQCGGTRGFDAQPMTVATSPTESLFSYGTLQLEAVQLATFGRRLAGTRDALPGFEQSMFEIEDKDVVATSGKSHHPIVQVHGARGRRRVRNGVRRHGGRARQRRQIRSRRVQAGDRDARLGYARMGVRRCPLRAARRMTRCIAPGRARRDPTASR